MAQDDGTSLKNARGYTEEEEVLKARTPLATRTQLNPDFSRRIGTKETDTTDVESEEEGGVGAKMRELSTERGRGTENCSPGKRFGRGSSPSSKGGHPQRTPKSVAATKRKPSEDSDPPLEPKDRAQVLHEMAQSIYATFSFSARPLTPIQPPSEDIGKKLEPISVKSEPIVDTFTEEQQTKPVCCPAPPVPKPVPVEIKGNPEWETLKNTVAELQSEVKAKTGELNDMSERYKDGVDALKTMCERVTALTCTLDNRDKELEAARKEIRQKKDEVDVCRRKEADLQILLTALETRLTAVEVEKQEQRIALTELKSVSEANQLLQKEVSSLKLSLSAEQSAREHATDTLALYVSQLTDLRATVEELQRRSCDTPFRVSNKSVTPVPSRYSTRRKNLVKDAISSPFSDNENSPETHSQPLACPTPMQGPVRYSEEDDPEYTKLLTEKRRVTVM